MRAFPKRLGGPFPVAPDDEAGVYVSVRPLTDRQQTVGHREDNGHISIMLRVDTV